MFTKILKISFFLILFFISSCGIKKSWEESGQYTTSESATATYVWKKGKQYIAIVHTIPVRGRNTKNTIHPINMSVDTISKSFSKIEYIITNKKGKKGDGIPVFSKRNIELLSKQIPEAVKRANKNQDILF